MNKIICIGLGYIGFPTAAMLAGKGLTVVGVDINERVVESVNKGETHIVEPGLSEVVEQVVRSGHLRATMRPEEGDVYLIVVPTPFRGNHEPDISYVETAIRSVIPLLKKGSLLIIESTSPVGTTDKMKHLVYSERPDLEGAIYMAYCPERVLPGNLLYELEYNDRVIGGIDEASTQKAMEFYTLFVQGDLHQTNATTAELVARCTDRFCQRTVSDLRQGRNQCLGADRAG